MSLTTAERFGAAEVLTDWPEDMTYDELLTAIESGNNDDVIIAEAYENYEPSYVVDQIEGIRVAFIRSVTAMTEDLRESIHKGDPMTIAEQLQSLESKLGY